MQAIELDGGALHYSDEGPRDAPAVVFANSLGTDLRVWDPLLAAAPELAGTLRVIRWDKPGHGLSNAGAPNAISGYSAAMERLLDHLQVARAAVVGLSVGGQIALDFARRAPERVTRAVFSNTAQKIGTPELWAERIETARARGTAALAPAVLERWFSASWRAARPAEAALWRAMVERTPGESYAAVCEALRDSDLTEAARGLRAPALCVAGTEDGSTPPEVVRALAELIPGAGFEVLEGVGHIPCVEAPEALAARIAPFLLAEA
ncbi:MAG: 3-oxoadipate enol-lactonase [Pseudomonadota bacterium]